MEVVETEMKKLCRSISVHSSMPKKLHVGEASAAEGWKNTQKHRRSKLSSKLSVRDKTLFEEEHDLRDKTLFEEQHDLLYRAIYPIGNCTKENLKITVRSVVDRVKNVNVKN